MRRKDNMSEINSAAPAASAPAESSTPNTAIEAPEGQEESLEIEASEAEGKSASKASKEEKKELKKTLRKLKLKVDKGEIEEDLPFDLPDDPAVVQYMQRQLQMAKMGGKRAQQYSELESEVRDFVDLLRSNPKKALSDPSIGLDLKKFAASIIEEEIENSRKSPEQLEKEKLAAELEALKKEREAEKEAARKKDMESRQKQEEERYSNLINKAISSSGLPNTGYVFKKTAEYMMLAMQEGIEVTPDDVMPLVKKDLNADLKDLFNGMSEDGIEEYVGKENLSRVRKRNLAKAKEKPVLPGNKIAKDVGATKSSEKKDDAKKVTLRELFDV